MDFQDLDLPVTWELSALSVKCRQAHTLFPGGGHTGTQGKALPERGELGRAAWVEAGSTCRQ